MLLTLATKANIKAEFEMFLFRLFLLFALNCIVEGKQCYVLPKLKY